MTLQKKVVTLHPQYGGAIAQLVEQRTENPCVAGSIPAGTTQKQGRFRPCFYFFSIILNVVPRPIVEFLTKIFPLWYTSIMRFANDKPSPQPLFLVV